MSDDAYRQLQTERGLQFQDHVVSHLLKTRGIIIQLYTSCHAQYREGESLNGIEIKLDNRYAETGNLWIEVGEKAQPREGDYARSGILREDNTWLYVIGNYTTLFAFAKRHLQTMHARGRYPVLENQRKTSKGFLCPDAAARLWAVFVDEATPPPLPVPAPVSNASLTQSDIPW